MVYNSKMADNSNSLQEYVQLMTQHQIALRTFIVSLLPGNANVSDVLQETNLVLWQKRNKFKHGTKFLAWAFTIARYEAMHERDRSKRDGRLIFSDELVNALADPEHESEYNDEKNERHLTALEHCMTKLESDERELINHRYTQGKSLEKLAEDCGKSPGSLRVALFRIRAALKKCIEIQLEKT